MRRLVTLFSAATLSLIGGVIGTSVLASGATDTTLPASSEAHPIIGTWMLTDTADPEYPFVAAFSADGTYVQVEEGDVGLGVWEPTGPTSAALTITQQLSAEDAGGIEGATITIRATIEVAPDGQSLSADYTAEVSGIEWMPTGEHGPGSVTGTRVAVEPMGTPVGSLEDLFGIVEDDTEGTAVAETTEVAAPPTTS